MRLFSRSAVAAEAEIAKPLAVVPKIAAISSYYSEIAAEIGLESPALIKNAIMAWLSRQEIKIYDTQRVHEYLARQVGDNGRIHWVPLRASDCGGPQWGGWRIGTNKIVSRMDHWLGNVPNQVYASPVPLHAIRLVRDMEASLGKESLTFYVSHALKVSDIPYLDPFLAVAPSIDRSDITVIDMWDEPGWSDRD